MRSSEIDVIVGKQENNDHGLSQILERQKELAQQLASEEPEQE